MQLPIKFLRDEHGTVLPILAAILLPFIAILIILFNLWSSDIERTHVSSKLYSCAIPPAQEYKNILLYQEGIHRVDDFIILKSTDSMISNRRHMEKHIALCMKESLALSALPKIMVKQKTNFVSSDNIAKRLWLNISIVHNAASDVSESGEPVISQQLPIKLVLISEKSGFKDYMLYRSEGYEVIHEDFVSTSPES